MPLVVARYVEVTDDTAVLDAVCPFLEGPLLGEGKTSDYGLPTVAAESGSLHEHCKRALIRSRRRGAYACR